MFVRGSGSVRLTRSQMWLGASPAQFTGQPWRWPVKSMSLKSDEIWNKGRVKSNSYMSIKLYHHHSHLIQEDLSFHYVASEQWLRPKQPPPHMHIFLIRWGFHAIIPVTYRNRQPDTHTLLVMLCFAMCVKMRKEPRVKHFICDESISEQPSATLWMPSRRDCLKMFIGITIFKAPVRSF